MNIDKLREEIASDEGKVLTAYYCSENHLTIGVGHKILPTDSFYPCKEGFEISEEKCNELFDEDVKSVIADCEKLVDDFGSLPEEVKRVIANLMFNMGLTRLSKFRKFIGAINAGAWQIAGEELRDSRYYRQVTNRANRLIERLNSVEET